MTARGFSLVEMVIVLAVAAVIIAIAVPALERYVEKMRLVQATDDINTMSKAIRQYEMSKGALPDALADAGLDGKTDPWGSAYEYFNLRSAKGNGQARKDKKLSPLNSDFDLYSIRPDHATHASLGNNASRNAGL